MLAQLNDYFNTNQISAESSMLGFSNFSDSQLKLMTLPRGARCSASLTARPPQQLNVDSIFNCVRLWPNSYHRQGILFSVAASSMPLSATLGFP